MNPIQMTIHEAKRANWLFMHPRADGRTLPKTAACYRCGRVREMENLKEVGDEVFRCKGGCGE